MRIVTYAIGDIHGRLDLLEDLLEKVEADAVARGASAKIVFTGDYVDRGEQSFGVVERLMKGARRPQDRFLCLRGNHDHLFVQAVRVGTGLPAWAEFLYGHTALSYAADEAGLHRHADFFASLPLTHDDGTRLFVHAGIRPGIAIAQQDDEDLLWIREGFLDHGGALPRLIVHGHTIMGDDPVVTQNRVSIDTGAYRSGVLTAAVFDGDDLAFLQTKGLPERGAIVREWILVARARGWPITADVEAAFDAYRAGDIDLVEMERRTRPEPARA